MIALATIAFNKPRCVDEQIRLLWKHLEDEWTLIVVDQSTNVEMAAQIREIVLANVGCVYVHPKTRMHHEGLNLASEMLLEEPGLVMPYSDAPYIGFLDHDIFPIRPTTLIDKIEEAGFYGVGQRHPATGNLYLWPGFCFFSREWLAGRPLDFTGYRDGDRRNDGDTGSGLAPLFADEDWEKMYRVPHAHHALRRPDEYGLQSWGYETLGDWLHFTNASGWMNVPKPKERERLLFDLLK